MPIEQNRDETGQDGSKRKAHYGDGKQPWDIICEAGWGPAFAAANVLKYIRRTKNPEHSFESACWYYRQLINHAREEQKIIKYSPAGRIWTEAAKKLVDLLTLEEIQRIAIQLEAEENAATDGPTRSKRP